MKVGRVGRFRGRGVSKKTIKKDKFKKREKKKFNIFSMKSINMKDVVRICHLKAPQYNINCLLGKKYPTSEEAFNSKF